MKQNNRTIILASQSPRRRELLGLLHIPFEIRPAMGEETSHAESPEVFVRELAGAKATEGYDSFLKENANGEPLVIGADTIVVCDNEILGKPKDRADAHRMISMLQGRSHVTMTGVALCWRGEDGDRREHAFVEQTIVHVAPMTEAEIEAYIDTPIPYDKAGAYGIQSEFGIYVSGIEGDYNNVVGLPLARLYLEMSRQGLL